MSQLLQIVHTDILILFPSYGDFYLFYFPSAVFSFTPLQILRHRISHNLHVTNHSPVTPVAGFPLEHDTVCSTF